jgi:hypothetical protein
MRQVLSVMGQTTEQKLCVGVRSLAFLSIGSDALRAHGLHRFASGL